MEWYLKKLLKMIKIYGKAKVAVNLNVTDTRTVDSWVSRGMIPSKYLDKIKELKWVY